MSVQSHQAYERGDGAGAKQLSDEGKRHQQKQAELNKQAAEYIFRENNAQGRVAEDTIDLHGMYVEEAENILEERIRYARSTGQSHLHVIVGKGNHSTGHVQKLKPRIEQLCREQGLDYATEENEGRIYVNLKGDRVDTAPPLPQQPHGYQGGYGGAVGGGYQSPPPQQHHQQPHSQQQQHHQQQQQQQYQPPQQQPQKQQEDDIFGCLKGCCLVM